MGDWNPGTMEGRWGPRFDDSGDSKMNGCSFSTPPGYPLARPSAPRDWFRAEDPNANTGGFP